MGVNSLPMTDTPQRRGCDLSPGPIAPESSTLMAVMASYRRVYDSRHLQADCQEPGSAPEPYAR